jgi:hypothetical protein
MALKLLIVGGMIPALVVSVSALRSSGLQFCWYSSHAL